MKVSTNGINFITEWEGSELVVYLDAVGKATVGVGHLVLPKDNLRVGQRITPAQVKAFLENDVCDAENAVNGCVKVPLTQNQFDALCSFVFNLGAGNLKKSTLLKCLNAKNYTLAADNFKKWVFADGKKLKGLVRRRKAEKDLFLK